MDIDDQARAERRTTFEDLPAQLAALEAGFRREGVARAAAPDGSDLIVWSRLPGDPPGPTPRYLPDLPTLDPRGGALTDGVLTMRRMEVADAAEVHPVRSSPDVVAWTTSGVAPTLAEVTRQCLYWRTDWLVGTKARLTIRDAATGAFAGAIGLQVEAPETAQAELDYYLSPAWRGRGYATRAVNLLCAWAFEHTALERLVAGVHIPNTASQRVLERSGFHREGHERSRLPDGHGGRVDIYTYARLR